MICGARKSAAPESMICWRASRKSGVGTNSMRPPRRCCVRHTSDQFRAQWETREVCAHVVEIFAWNSIEIAYDGRHQTELPVIPRDLRSNGLESWQKSRLI